MAIAYLVGIDLNNNQLLDFKVDNRTSDQTDLSGVGQLIYRTDINVLKYHTGSNNWVTIGKSTDSWILSGDSGTNQTISNDNVVLISGGSYLSSVVSATDTLTISHNDTARTDTSSSDSPTHGTAFTVIDSVSTNATGHVTGANVKTITLPNDNDTSLPIKNSAGTLEFTAEDTEGIRFGATGGSSVTFNSATKLVTYNSADNNETYTLPVSAGGTNNAVLSLTAGGTGSGVKSTVSFIGGSVDRILVTENAVNNGSITIDLPDTVVLVEDLEVGRDLKATRNLSVTGLGSFIGEVTVPTATADGNAPNLGQVKLLIAGVGVFQGSYDADANSPALEGGSNIALEQGDYFVVSVAGEFLGESLEPGNFIFANNAIAANSSPDISNYTTVKADDNVAGAGATDGDTQKGVAGFDSENFTVSANGWVKLIDRSVAGTKGSASKSNVITTSKEGIITAASDVDINITASQVSDFCTAVQTCVADNSDTVLIGDGTATSYTITHNYNTRKIAVQTVRAGTPYDTVYMDVERTTVNTITLTTTTALAANAVEVYLQIIK